MGGNSERVTPPYSQIKGDQHEGNEGRGMDKKREGNESKRIRTRDNTREVQLSRSLEDDGEQVR